MVLFASCREETGDFFAVDIGGTNYRVILVSLSEKKGEVVSCPVRLLVLAAVNLAVDITCVQASDAAGA